MGNKVSNNYSVEKFVNEINLKNLINIPEEEIKQKLMFVLEIFSSDKEAFKNLLAMEEDTKKKKQEGEDKKDEEFNSHRFCKIISSIIKHNFTSDNDIIYKYIIDIMSFLCKIF
jgi:hypothetical protein